MTEDKLLTFTETINAPLPQIYAAFSSSIDWESWFADFVEVVFSEKNRIYCWWNVGYYASGLFTKIIENEQIAFTWNGPGEPHDTLVTVFFDTKGEDTEVTIQHSGIGSGDEWKERIAAYTRGWETALENLKSVMETGLDKRVYERPMLGIIPGALMDEKQAAELDTPVVKGVRLVDTLDGMGAAAAGLKKDDVITFLNGHELLDYPDFGAAIGRCKAGDVVEVIFYRGPQKHTVEMELSHRPIPEAYATAAELAEATAKIYAEVAIERDALFEGVTDAEASVRPSPEEWSAKETLVHLLYTERWLHLAISCAVSGQRTGGFANQLELIAAMASAYSLEALLAELKASEAVTVASFKALPDDFVADKRKFYGLANFLGQGFAQHTRGHFDQIKAAIEHARQG